MVIAMNHQVLRRLNRKSQNASDLHSQPANRLPIVCGHVPKSQIARFRFYAANRTSKSLATFLFCPGRLCKVLAMEEVAGR